jgi:hypothetical protein
MWIATRQSFLAHYDEIVNPAERCAITAAKDSNIWGNWQGYTIGSGVVWWGKEASKDDQKPGQEIDWTGIPFKVKTFKNIDVMTEGCMKLNVVQTLLPNNTGDAKGTVLIDFHPADAFFTRFQKEVGRDDREKVADMVRYPVNLRIGGQQVVATDRARFLQLYDAVFQPLTRSLLLGEHGSDLTVRWEGISDPSTIVEFAPVFGTNEFRITCLADSPRRSTTNQ